MAFFVATPRRPPGRGSCRPVESKASHSPWKTLRVSHSSHRLDDDETESFIHHVRGRYSASITVDNGTEFTSRHFDSWAYFRSIAIDFIRPGRPVENAYIESFNGRLREECLSQHWFRDLAEARSILRAWRRDYNETGLTRRWGACPPASTPSSYWSGPVTRRLFELCFAAAWWSKLGGWVTWESTSVRGSCGSLGRTF